MDVSSRSSTFNVVRFNCKPVYVMLMAMMARSVMLIAMMVRSVMLMAMMARSVMFIAMMARSVMLIAMMARSVMLIAMMARSVMFIAMMVRSVMLIAMMARSVMLIAIMVRSAMFTTYINFLSTASIAVPLGFTQSRVSLHVHTSFLGVFLSTHFLISDRMYITPSVFSLACGTILLRTAYALAAATDMWFKCTVSSLL